MSIPTCCSTMAEQMQYVLYTPPSVWDNRHLLPTDQRAAIEKHAPRGPGWYLWAYSEREGRRLPKPITACPWCGHPLSTSYTS